MTTPGAAQRPVALIPGNVRHAWCEACKAYTVLAGDVLVLTGDGVATAGAWAWCEICDDPANEEGPRRG